MGKPFTIQIEDDLKIEDLKKKTGLKTKIEVVRMALNVLESELVKKQKIQRWAKVAKIVGDADLEILKEFQTKDRFKDLP
ncbi:MAG: hypothetical protein ABL930_00060 [Pseudobdellovibrio sp.]